MIAFLVIPLGKTTNWMQVYRTIIFNHKTIYYVDFPFRFIFSIYLIRLIL